MKLDIHFDIAPTTHPKADLMTGCVITMNSEAGDHRPAGGMKLVGVAFCSRNDDFTAYGKKLAFTRAVSPLRPELRKYLWKEFSQRYPEALNSREQRGR